MAMATPARLDEIFFWINAMAAIIPADKATKISSIVGVVRVIISLLRCLRGEMVAIRYAEIRLIKIDNNRSEMACLIRSLRS